MRLIALIVLALLALPTMAETLKWNPPTARADGTPLDPMTDIDEYRLYCGDVVTSIEPVQEVGNQYQFRKHEILPDYGTWDCSMTTLTVDGLESSRSEPVTIKWEPANPLAPTDVVYITE